MRSRDAGEPPRYPLASPPPREQPFLTAKLHAPPARASWIARTRLVEALDRALSQPVTLVAAPAGYGKTTMAAQWLDGPDRPPTAWVSLDRSDNDPQRLMTDIHAALEQVGCVPPVEEQSWSVGRGPGAPGAAAPAVLNAMAAMTDDVVLVLDDFHLIQTPECHEQVEFLVEHLPAQAHLVIISRSDPGLRLGRLRASGDLAEIRAQQLGFTSEEAVEVLSRAGVHLGDDTVEQLMEHTEGWPAGVYLAALSLHGRSDPDDFVRQFSKGHRFVGDYLTEEVLSRQPDRVREFITTVAILDRFTASLADHVVGIGDSASIIRDLERSNLFLVPLDEAREWVRFHHLFAAVARSELEIKHPGRLSSLHARASEWFRAQGHIDEAVAHSLAAGDASDVAGLVQSHWLTYVDAGRARTVYGWLEALGPPNAETEPATWVVIAWMASLMGNETLLAQSADALRGLGDVGPLPDGSHSVESALAMIDGLFGYGGPIRMMAGARRAVELETDSQSPYFAIANVTLGHAAYVAGDLAGAVAPLERASRSDRAPGIVRALGLATHSLVAAESGDRARSCETAEEAMRIVELGGLRAMPQASLAFTALGEAEAAGGNLEEALATLELGLSLRRRTSAHGPWGMIHHLLSTARVAAAAGRYDMARELVAELQVRMKRYPEGMRAMQARLESVQQLLRAQDAADALDEPLTEREVDVLRLLPSSLSVQQIASELFLTSNTVKTHARAVYRKLGAHSRADAIRIARSRSLL